MILERAAQNREMAKMALFWRNLLKTVCFGQNGFILAKDAQKRGFGHNGFFLAKDAQNSGFGENGLLLVRAL